MANKGFHNKTQQYFCESPPSPLDHEILMLQSLFFCVQDVGDRIIQAQSSDIYKLVNRLFGHSLFWKQEIEATHKYHPVTKKRFYYPKRSQERYPVFILFLTCPPSTVDIFLDPAKNVVEFHVRLTPSSFTNENRG